jgi:hypothetical protein
VLVKKKKKSFDHFEVNLDFFPPFCQVVLLADGEQSYPNMADMFSVVGNLLDMLNECLLHVRLQRTPGQDGEGGGGSVTLMNLMGEEIGEKVAYESFIFVLSLSLSLSLSSFFSFFLF